ncbi:MAG: Lrp/AsnC family transcriptional regulator [Immundisolibacteraceae bacterium]|nr:Lrp/AsnC family transcriptional regulator [Immundisolibacteraceae bacterium]
MLHNIKHQKKTKLKSFGPDNKPKLPIENPILQAYNDLKEFGSDKLKLIYDYLNYRKRNRNKLIPFTICGTTVKLKKRQILISYSKLSKKLNIAKTTVYDIVQKLIKTGLIKKVFAIKWFDKNTKTWKGYTILEWVNPFKKIVSKFIKNTLNKIIKPEHREESPTATYNQPSKNAPEQNNTVFNKLFNKNKIQPSIRANKHINSTDDIKVDKMIMDGHDKSGLIKSRGQDYLDFVINKAKTETIKTSLIGVILHKLENKSLLSDFDRKTRLSIKKEEANRKAREKESIKKANEELENKLKESKLEEQHESILNTKFYEYESLLEKFKSSFKRAIMCPQYKNEKVTPDSLIWFQYMNINHLDELNSI